MRFISIWKPTTISGAPSQKMMDEMGAFIAETVSSGVLLATDGFGPSTKNDLVCRRQNGEFTLTDGPFTEAKELIGGFAIMRVKTREEMVELTRRFMAIAGDGECEIHLLTDESPLDQMRR